MDENELGATIVDSALKVHSAIGPGLLESVYETCLAHELSCRGVSAQRQHPLSIRYSDLKIDNAYRMDLLVNDCVVVEIKSVDAIVPVHRSQLLSYLKLGGYKLGFLLNFNVAHMRQGIARLVNGL